MKPYRTTRGFRRRQATRAPRLRILVVTEGAITEGLYVSLLIGKLRPSNVQVRVMGRECGSDPLTVVEFAAREFFDDDGYDICYCLVDRDSHPIERFNAAIAKSNAVNSKSARRQFMALVSYPCIELWFILHFKYVRAPFVAAGAKSAGDMAVAELKKLLPAYSKNNRDAISSLIPLTDQAIENAKKAQDDVEKTGDLNPSTSVYIMVQRLKDEADKS